MRYPALRLVIPAAAIGAGLVASVVTRSPSAMATAVQASAPAQDEQRPVFRGGTTFVYLDVYPRQDGLVLEGLTKDDFEVTEDGKPQAVETFQFIKYDTALVDEERRDPTSAADSERQAADPRNRLFVVYLDPYFTTFDGGFNAKSTVMAFIERTIGATDLFGVMTPESSVAGLTFARRLETLEGDLDDFWTSVRSDGDRKDWPRTPVEQRIMECVSGNPDLFRGVIRLYREDALMNNLENLMVRLGALREERKNVLFISEGWAPTRTGSNRVATAGGRGSIPTIGVGPTGRLGIGNQQPYDRDANWCEQQQGRLASIDFEQRFRDFLTQARQANVSFYPVDVGGLKVDFTPLDRQPSQTLLTLAENTDGLAVINTNDLTGAVRKLTNSLAGMYLLGYYSTNQANNGRYRQIKVRVKKPDIDVSARQGYFAPTAAMMAAAARATATPPAPPTPVDHELSRLARARPDAELFAYGAAQGDQLTIVAELSSREMESGRWKAGGEVKATVQPEGGTPSTVTAKIDPGARVTTLSMNTAGTTGPWKIDLRVSGTGNVLDGSASVAHGAGPLLAEPMLFRANPSPRAPLRAVADFQYRRTERIHVEWRTLKALTDQQARLLDSRGQPLPLSVSLTGRDDPAGKTVVADVTLAPLAEGNYVIELTGTAGTESQRALVAFKVVR